MKTTIVLMFLVAALLGSLFLNYLFYTKAFIPFHALRLDPMERGKYAEKQLKKEENNQKKTKPILLFYGDSRALSWRAPQLDQYHVINRAIGGQTSVQIAARFPQHVAPYKPQTVVIQFCVNDLKMISLFPDKQQNIIHNCKQNIQQVLQQAETLHAKVILSTVFPLGDISFARKVLGMKESVIIAAIDEVNTFIHTLASDNTKILDAYQLLKRHNGRKVDPRYSRDWLHLNPQGYAVLNKALNALLNIK